MGLKKESEVKVLETFNKAGARPVGRPPGSSEGGRVAAAFRRYFDASPQTMDKIVKASAEKAMEGDTTMVAFIRDTMDGKPIQRTDAVITTNNMKADELGDDALAARIASLEAEDTNHTEH